MQIGKKNFAFDKHTYIMGILNVTPDSFSDGGNYSSVDAALLHTEEMIKKGAHIIDVGGESTRPGYVKISTDEEIERICQVVMQIKKHFDIPVSVDTYKADVASAALDAGADMINDIWGLVYQEEGTKMADIIAEKNVPVCIMHNRKEALYENFLQEVKSDLLHSVKIAITAGIKKENIILDPGVGFGKTYEQNLQIMKHLSEICQLDYPVLLGTSRKSMIGLTLDLPVTEREEGTIATTVMAVMAGCGLVRVHDVEKNFRAVQMTEKIIFCEK